MEDQMFPDNNTKVLEFLFISYKCWFEYLEICTAADRNPFMEYKF